MRWLPLVQMIDSAFPTGAFSHSFGMETALQESNIRNAKDLLDWLVAYVSGNLVPMEGAAVYWSHHYAEKILNNKREQDIENLKLLDHRLTLSKMAQETRDGGIKVGKRYLHMVSELYPESRLKEYEEWIRRGECYGNNCIVHGWICAYLQLSPQVTILSHLYGGVNNLIQNALRAMAIGQTEGQKVLHSLMPLLEKELEELIKDPPAPDDLASYTLIQEIQAMRHETLYSRLFMS